LVKLYGMNNWKTLDKMHVWHPFTQMQTEGDPLYIDRADGVWMYDTEGRKYLDANSSWWVNLHGHSHPAMIKEIEAQLKQLQHVIFAGVAHQPAAKLCKALKGYLPKSYEKFFFSDNGSTAVEVALKMSFQYWYNKGKSKRKVIALEGAYHGDTFGAMSVSERDVFNRPFEPFLFDVVYLPFPTEENKEEVLYKLEEYLSSDDVAAFIFEPLVQGAAGMRMYSAEMLNTLIKHCKRAEVICIADEIMTGFGRTGKMFACDYIEEDPDIMCLSKGLTGGYLPMGLTCTTLNMYEVFLSEKKQRGFLHGHSFTGNPLACAAALASIELFTTDTFTQIENISKAHQNYAKSIASKTDHKVRSCGTILAIDIKTKAETGYFNPARSKVYQFFKERGLIIRPLGNTIFINPPYCITPEELSFIYKTVDELLVWIKD